MKHRVLTSWRIAGTVVVLLSVTLPPGAWAEDLTKLSDEALAEHYRRDQSPEVWAEFSRRLESLTDEEERMALVKLMARSKSRPKLPSDSSTDELIETLHHILPDPSRYEDAVSELERRYDAGTEAERAAIAGALRKAILAVPVPMEPDDARAEGRQKLLGLSRAICAALPEAEAAELLHEAYIVGGVLGGYTAFLSRLSENNVGGPVTAAYAEEVMRLRTATPLPVWEGEMGEAENIASIGYSVLAHCGRAGFEAVQRLHWPIAEDGAALHAVAVFPFPEARDLLMAKYRERDADHRLARARNLAALDFWAVREKDEATLRFVCAESAGLLDSPRDRSDLRAAEVLLSRAIDSENPCLLPLAQVYGPVYRSARPAIAPQVAEDDHILLTMDELTAKAESRPVP